MTALHETRRALLLVAAGVVALRLPFLADPAAPDEAGFLTVAQQWHAAGRTLYSAYWVDRPPLLIGLFQVADALGGLSALRVLGALAAAVTVLLGATAAWRATGPVGGRRAAVTAALVAAALLVSPAMGATEVNGELLAAPFVAAGALCVVVAMRPRGPRSAAWAAIGAGAAAAAALLVKQNMADVVVLAAVAWGLRPAVRAVRAVAGAAAVTALVAGWAALHGTSPAAVAWAMYPFRVRAAQSLASRGATAVDGRMAGLLGLWALTLTPLLLAVLAGAVVQRRLRGRLPVAVLVTCAYDAVSIGLGGSFWSHYLVEAVVPLALGAGLLAGALPRTTRALTGLVAAAALAAWASALAMPPAGAGTVVGRAVGASARAGDSVVSAFGDADIVRASGLRSPYPYLWSLPAHVLDPSFTGLDAVLAGRSAPTWVVVRGTRTLDGIRHSAAGPALRRDYRPVGHLCSRTVFLHRGLHRPPLASTCTAVASPLDRVAQAGERWDDLVG